MAHLNNRKVYFPQFVEILNQCFFVRHVQDEIIRREKELEYLKDSEFIWSKELKAKLKREVRELKERRARGYDREG